MRNRDLKKQIEQLNLKIHEFKGLGLPIGWVLQSEDTASDFVITYQPLQNPLLSLIGWFLTALAGALGAPFWFDALSNLFAIRGTGKKPEESTSSTLISPSPTIQVIVPPASGSTTSLSNAANDYETSALNSKDIERLQRILGIPEPRINDQLTEELRTVLREWQRSHGRPVTGQFDESTVRALFESEAVENGYSIE